MIGYTKLTLEDTPSGDVGIRLETTDADEPDGRTMYISVWMTPSASEFTFRDNRRKEKTCGS